MEETRKEKMKKAGAVLIVCAVVLVGQGIFWHNQIKDAQETVSWVQKEDVAETGEREVAADALVKDEMISENTVLPAEEEKAKQDEVIQAVAEEVVISKHMAQDIDKEAEEETESVSVGKVAKEVSCDPSLLQGWMMPMQGEVTHGYGFGYSDAYKDIRFFDYMLFEGMGRAEVVAPMGGTVVKAEKSEDGWTVTVETSQRLYRIWGMEDVVKEVGDVVVQGEVLGYGKAVSYKVYSLE